MKPLDRTVDILGTKYVILFRKEEHDKRLNECEGFIDISIKEITVCIFERDYMSIQDLKSYTNKVIRHEIIHAFLYESGLWNNSTPCNRWATNEEMVDWLAIQFHKIQAAFVEADCICKRKRGM